MYILSPIASQFRSILDLALIPFVFRHSKGFFDSYTLCEKTHIFHLPIKTH